MDICMNMIDRGYRVIEIVFGRSIEKVVEMTIVMIDKMVGYSLCVDR
jgi:hypothetical protein